MAANAVDGSLSTCSWTKYDRVPWLTVDLQNVYNITQVVLANMDEPSGSSNNWLHIILDVMTKKGEY